MSTASSDKYYGGFDSFPYPFTSTSQMSSERIGTDVLSTGTSDFAMTALANNTILIMGGTDGQGSLVKLDAMSVWSNERDWYTLPLTGDVPQARIGASLSSHPILDDLA